ncbi:nucleolar protein 13 [Coccidioides immitis RMSCC 3703]|nr:nucleolar protein 13 [Coccidioides immitis RMSCC 3703]
MGDRPDSSPNASRKRKLDPDIEIDLAAPEPPSKKALRKAKKKSTAKVDDAQAITSKSETQPPPQEPTNKRSGFGIWIGNLPFSVAQDDLRNFLTTKGPFTPDEITRIHLPQGEKRNGKQLNKGFAYIDFSTSGAVQRAIALSEQLLAGRAVLIKDANNFAGRPDKPRDDGGTSMGSKTSANPPSKKIFVGNLAFDITKEMLEEHYRPCGGISHVHIATFEDSGKCKG